MKASSRRLEQYMSELRKLFGCEDQVSCHPRWLRVRGHDLGRTDEELGLPI